MQSMLRYAAAGVCLLAGSLPPATSLAASSSSVTLYGLIDSGVQYLSNGPEGHSKVGMSSGNWNGSRWGMKGAEDLGGGRSAVFVLESGFDTNNGKSLQGNRLFGRQAYVGLSDKDLGQLTLGRHNTLMIDWMSKYNPFDNANFSGKRMDAAFSDRADNAVKYVGKFGPVFVGAYYSFGWNNEQDFEDKTKGRMFGAGLRYKSGGWDAALLYHRKHADAPGAGATSDNREDRVVAGLSYDFGGVKLYGGYRWLKQRLTARDYRSNMYWVGVGYKPAAPTTLSLAVYQLDGTVCDNMNVAACPAVQGAGSDQNPTLIIAGAEYDLSKRTTLYALGAYAMNDHGSSLSVIGGKYGANVEPGKDQFGMSVGIRHRF